MRDTNYAEELCEPGVVRFDATNEGRLERLRIKESDVVEIRFSWWKNGNITTRPLDLSEETLLVLIADALPKGVFTENFRSQLRNLQ